MTTPINDQTKSGPVLPGLVVDPGWLEEHLGVEALRIVDLRDREAYTEGHVPGAVRLDLEALGENFEGRDNVLLPPPDFERLMTELGISHRDSVVAYDDHWGLPAARLIWALHYYGGGSVVGASATGASAAVLNGGWDRWQEEGRPTTDGSESESESAPGPLSMPGSRSGSLASGPERVVRFEAHPNPDVAADYERVASGAARGDIVLLDTRSTVEFDQGHLPGAVSWDWFNAVPVDSWNCSRDPEKLRAELAALGVRPTDEIVAYCRSGMRVAHTWVVLRNAGFPRVRLYDGSWQEWSMRGTPDLHGDS